MDKEQLNLSYLHFFPYSSFRVNQESFIKDIEKYTSEQKNTLLEAPNGTGKTIIALSSVLPVAIKNQLKIIYLCRTHAQNARVIKELKKIADKLAENELNIKVNGISIRGRSQMCLNKNLIELNLSPQDSAIVCEDLRNNENCIHYENLQINKSEIIDSSNLFKSPTEAEEIIKFSKERILCPYFLSKFLLEKVPLVVCNYQWIYNPSIYPLFLMFLGASLNKCILIQDECHNLIDIATDVNSETIIPYHLTNCMTDLSKYKGEEIFKTLVKSLQNTFRSRKEKLKEGEAIIDPESFLINLIKKIGLKDIYEFKEKVIELLAFSEYVREEKADKDIVSRDHLGNLAKFWLKWLKVYTLDSYFFCYRKELSGERTFLSIEINALDPREISIPILRTAFSTVNLTGTVIPHVFINLMGFNNCEKDIKEIIGESPFPKENIRAFISRGINTKYDNRKPEMYAKMISKIEEVVSSTPANIGVFCASYKIVNALKKNGIESIIKKYGKKVFYESSELKASENALMLEDFKSVSSPQYQGGVLIGVCGGRNSEGEDYPGDYMNSVIIAGFPYQFPTPLLKAKIRYYNKVFEGQGWNFAYLFPAMLRANQASGRPIRTINDKGCILFLDERFEDKRNWISHWLRDEIEILTDKENQITNNLKSFWK